MVDFKALMGTVYASAATYSTVRVASIKSWKIAVMFRFFQLAVIGYIVGWSIVYKKGYQSFDAVSSAVTTKVKGLGYIYGSKENGTIPRIFDTADYVVPPSEYDSIFVLSNFVETKQTQGVCDEDYTKVNCLCKVDADCNSSIATNVWNGIPTGKCIQSSVNSSVTVCEIASWCPVEREEKNDHKNVIDNVASYTIFIKNDIQFRLFNKKQRNLLSNITNAYISTCTYERNRDPYCPVFQISTILEEAEPDPSERAQMLQKGGVLNIAITWDCNYDLSDTCLPKYRFSRFDLPFNQTSAASGFNFRFADKYEINSTMYRSLVKAYGLKFIISVDGKAGKFDFIPLLITLGAGLGLLSVATLIADFILLYLTKQKEMYRELKQLKFSAEDDEEAGAQPKKMSLTLVNPNYK